MKSSEIKNYASENIIFLGYIKSNEILTCLYENCFAYIHGHQYGGTNPTMINALYLNCQTLALDTIFNREMLAGKKAVYFKKELNSISKSIIYFENNFSSLLLSNKDYKLQKKYDWNNITEEYKRLFNSLI